MALRCPGSNAHNTAARKVVANDRREAPEESARTAAGGRLDACFARLRSQARKALSAFITAGDPSIACTVPAMAALVRGGADIIELGVPFSDPEADGPSIQAASERALKRGVTLADTLATVARFRGDDRRTPVVLMGYLNVFLKYGCERFCADAAGAGVDGVIIVNMPPEEADEFRRHLAARGLALVLLVAPTTTLERAAFIAARASGFLYYVSYKGVTGARRLDAAAIGDRLAALRPQLEGLPVLVGFGIRDADAAAAVAPHADGVVVGSALVDTMGTAAVEAIPARLEAQARAIRAGLDGG